MNPIIICIMVAASLAIIVGGGYVSYKFIKHERYQNDEIKSLRSEVSVLNLKINNRNIAAEWGNGFNYLAIGNSITKHGVCDYWWQECGMAASKKENDYFHLVSAYLRNIHNEVTAYCFNGSTWEIQNHDRSEVLSTSIWDGYLSEKLNLVTIQLSENVSDLETFEGDFGEMVKYVKRKCPNAQIIVIDDFWSNEKSEVKKKAVESLSCEFVDLSEIRGKSKYQAGIGTVVYDSEGGEHIIKHNGVAKHPGDDGMQYYAKKIIKKIKLKI